MASISTTDEETDRPIVAMDRVPGPGIDFATLLGAVGAFTVIALAMAIGGSPEAFIDVPSLLIVFGGTFLVTTISFSFGEILKSQGIVLRALVFQREIPETAAYRIMVLADAARRSGVLALEKQLSSLQQNRFLSRAVTLIVDGTPTEDIERILNSEIQATADRHLRAAGVLRRAGEVAPAMGLIGTLVGLVQMLGSLEDPTVIGPAMAVALLTTFYGAIMANMVFLPLANKLERNSQVEIRINQIYALGAASISRQENPRRLEIFLNTILSPGGRMSFFD